MDEGRPPEPDKNSDVLNVGHISNAVIDLSKLLMGRNVRRVLVVLTRSRRLDVPLPETQCSSVGRAGLRLGSELGSTPTPVSPEFATFVEVAIPLSVRLYDLVPSII